MPFNILCNLGENTAHCSGARLVVTGGVMELTSKQMSVGFLDPPTG